MLTKKKKVGVLAFVDKYDGGVYQYTQSIIDALKNDNEKEYIIFCNYDDTRFDSCPFEVRQVKRFKNSYLIKLIRVFQLLFFIRKPYFFTQRELNIFNDIELFMSPCISSYPHFFMKIPFVFTLHDMQEKYLPQFFSIQERVHRWINNRALCRFSEKIICESSYVKNDIVKFIGVDENKVKIIQSPPAAEFLDFKFDNLKFDLIRKKYELPQKYIFYPAQCWFHKNHINLISAFYKVSNNYDNIYLVLTGSKQNNYEFLTDKINHLNLNDKVKHMGYIEYEDLPYFYKMSQMLVMPTLFESVSIPIYEAFSLEVPVCSSNVVALPEQVGEGGILFDPNNIDDMAKKIMIYLDNNDFASKKAKIGLNSIKSFNYMKYQRTLLDVINAN